MKITTKAVHMTVLGKIVAAEANKKIISEGMVRLSVLDYLSQVLPLGTKTIQRRLSDDEWSYKNLLAIQLHFKSDAVQKYIDAQFTEAVNS
jgi:hypothetical protein